MVTATVLRKIESLVEKPSRHSESYRQPYGVDGTEELVAELRFAVKLLVQTVAELNPELVQPE